jgi:chromosome segregation ATPase
MGKREQLFDIIADAATHKTHAELRARIATLEAQLAEAENSSTHWLNETRRVLKAGQDAVDRITTLKAQLAEANRRNGELEREVFGINHSYFKEREARIALEPTPPAPKVTEASVRAALKSLHENSLSWEHPDAIRAALTAAQEPGRS